MKFKWAEKDTNFPIEHFVSEGGVWECGITPVLYGRRVRVGRVGDNGCVLDYCAGDRMGFDHQVLTAVMGILLKVPEETPEWIVMDMFPTYHVKPIDRDPTCWKELQALYEKTWRSSQTRRFTDVSPCPEWHRANVEHLRSLPPPSLEKVRAQMQASEDYRRRFDELGDIVR